MTLATRPPRHMRARPARRVDLASAKPPTADKGSSGGVSWGGILSTLSADYAEAWRPPSRWTTIEKMRADPAVSAALAAVTYPILAAELTVEPASDDPDDVERAEFIDAGLNSMTVDLATHRAETLDAVGDGVALFYPRFERREDGLWWLRKLKLLPNKSIVEWNVDEGNGSPTGVTQLKPNGELEFFDLEKGELLAFTHARRGDALWGRPALRAMYRPWYLIDKMSRMGAIAVERTGVGIPWARYTGGSTTERDKLDAALMGLHVHEQAFLRVDEDTPDWGFMGVTGSTVDVVPQMEYQRRDLFLALLTQFLALGTGDVGAFALSEDHSSFFLMALQTIAREIEETYNRYLIPRWIGYNWTVPTDQMPRVKMGSLDRRSVTEWAAAVAALIGAGVTLPADVLTEEAAGRLGITLPDADVPDAGGDVADPNDPNAPEVGADGEQLAARADGAVDLAAGPLKSPVMLEALGIPVGFVRMSEAMDKARDRIRARVAPHQKAIAGKVAGDMMKLIRAGDADALEGYEIPYDDEAALIEEEMRTVYGLGGDELAGELQAQGVKPADPSREDEAAALALMGAASRSYASGLAGRMKQAAVSAALQQILTGRVDRAALAAVVTAAPDSLLGQIGAQGAALALNVGRRLWSEANAASVDYELWTAAMDANTCPQCRALDGQRFAVGEGPAAPLAECDGGARCRCTRVPVAKGRGRDHPPHYARRA